MAMRNLVNPDLYAGYAPGQAPPQVGGQPWGMPAATMGGGTAQPPGPPGQVGPYQGLGNWGNDPFGYTNGSILTPWTQPLPGMGTGGGVATPNLTPWSYKDFNYDIRQPEGYQASQFAAPDKFTYMNFDQPGAFRPPSEAEMMADPAYKASLGAGQQAIEGSAARSGTLRTGGTLKDLAKFGAELGTQTYDKIYGRRASEYDRAYGISKDVYGTNRANAAENYDRNFRTGFDVHNANEAARLGGYQASTDASLRGQQLGFEAATGAYDRNRQNAKEGWESQQEMARAAAAAANAGNERDYQRAMDQYQMAYGIFQNNQATQFDRMMAMTQLGYGAAGQQAGYAGNYGGTMGDLYTGAGNARAAGIVGGANAINAGLGGIGDTAMDLYAYSRMAPRMPGAPVPVTYPRR